MKLTNEVLQPNPVPTACNPLCERLTRVAAVLGCVYCWGGGLCTFNMTRELSRSTFRAAPSFIPDLMSCTDLRSPIQFVSFNPISCFTDPY